MTYRAADTAVHMGTSIFFTRKSSTRKAGATQMPFRQGRQESAQKAAAVEHGPSFLSQDGEKIKRESRTIQEKQWKTMRAAREE
jgi:hypothetical protein